MEGLVSTVDERGAPWRASVQQPLPVEKAPPAGGVYAALKINFAARPEIKERLKVFTVSEAGIKTGIMEPLGAGRGLELLQEEGRGAGVDPTE